MSFNIPLMIYDAFARRAQRYRDVDEYIDRLYVLYDRLEKDRLNGSISVIELDEQEDITRLINNVLP